MTDATTRATSFGAIASDYDRLRPTPPAAALDWLVPADCEVAVDLAAGTGLFTRELQRRVAHVIAVEPDERMRAVLQARSPAVEVRAGWGEDLPLPDSSVDALFVSSAWHWIDPDRALPEIARVLRDGGRLGVLWTSRDQEVDWIRGLNALRNGSVDGVDVHAASNARRRDLRLAGDHSFVDLEYATFPFTRRMALDDVVEMLGTYSGAIVAGSDVRAAALENARALLEQRFPGAAEIDLPMRSWCWRADRVSRSG